MLIRNVKDSDIPMLEKMLGGEGVDRIGGIIRVMEDDGVVGFYSYAVKDCIPFLWHFCIAPKHRTFKRALFLIKAYRKYMRELGYYKSVILLEKEYLGKLVERHFKVSSLGVVDNQQVYFVEV